MALKQTAYDSLMAGISKNEDFSEAFNMIIRNPYRILGASTFCTQEELEEMYLQWEAAPEKYKTKFDKTKLGPPERTPENMKWALENADSYVYKIFWFSDAEVASKLGNKGNFIEFFGRRQGVNDTDYNSFLAQYIFLCIFDRKFTMTEQWGIILNLINDLLNVSVGRFWGFFSGNKIDAIDNNKMAFLYNEFKDNILFPIKDIIQRQGNRINVDEIIHIHNLLSQVERAQLPFSKLDNLLFERLEKWFIKESDYVNNVLLANVSGINATSMEEKLSITNAYNYIMNDIVPTFESIVNNIIPPDHSLNTRLRMMFSGKFIVVSKILSNAGLYAESLKLCQKFNELFEDDYITGEINNLSKIIRQDETTRMAPHAIGTAMGNASQDKESGLAMPAELGELEALEKERKKEFFIDRHTRTGIDYKEVIQGVLNNELRLVRDEDRTHTPEVPYVDRMAAEVAATAEAENYRLKNQMAELQKRHEDELNRKIYELNYQYKKSMRKWVIIILLIVVLLFGIIAFTFFEFKGTSPIDGVKITTGESAETQDNSGVSSELAAEKAELVDMESRLNQLILEKNQLQASYEATYNNEVAEQLTQKTMEYDALKQQYDEKVMAYNQHKETLSNSN